MSHGIKHNKLLLLTAQACLSKVRPHLRPYEKYVEKYGPKQKLGRAATR